MSKTSGAIVWKANQLVRKARSSSVSVAIEPASAAGSAPRRLAFLRFVSVTFAPQIADISRAARS